MEINLMNIFSKKDRLAVLEADFEKMVNDRNNSLKEIEGILDSDDGERDKDLPAIRSRIEGYNSGIRSYREAIERKRIQVNEELQKTKLATIENDKKIKIEELKGMENEAMAAVNELLKAVDKFMDNKGAMAGIGSLMMSYNTTTSSSVTAHNGVLTNCIAKNLEYYFQHSDSDDPIKESKDLRVNRKERVREEIRKETARKIRRTKETADDATKQLLKKK